MPALLFLMVVVGGAFWWFENPDLQEQAKQICLVVGACAAVYWGYRQMRKRMRFAQHGRLIERLRSFAAGLTHGQFSAPGFFEGGTAKITGVYDGLRLQLNASFGDRSYIAYELMGLDCRAEFDAEPASFFTRLTSDERVRYTVPLVERRGGSELALRRLFEDLGIDRVCLSHGTLHAMGPASEHNLSPDRLFTVFRELGKVARTFQKKRPQGAKPRDSSRFGLPTRRYA